MHDPKIKNYTIISSIFAIIGVLAIFSLPVVVTRDNPPFPFWYCFVVGVPALTIASIFGSASNRRRALLDNGDENGDITTEEKYNKFLHGLDSVDISKNAEPTLSDAELEVEINKLTPKIKLYNNLGKACTILGIFAFFPLVMIFPLLGFLPILTGVIFVVKALGYEGKLKGLVSNNIVRGVLADSFTLEVYAPGSHIPQDTVEQTKLIDRNWNRISGSDLVEGVYKGVKFSFSDLHLQHVTSSGKNRKVVTRFEGQWLTLKLAKALPQSVVLKERDNTNKNAKSDAETENMEFNQKFHITAGDPHTAFYLLTPHFMEYILQADKRADARTCMSFGGREVHIALHNGRNLFEPCGKKLYDKRNIELLRNQMRWDVKYITGIIDELLLNETLFKTSEV